MLSNYTYLKGKNDFAQKLIEELYGQIEPSRDAWDRGFNSALCEVIRRIKKLISISYTLPDGTIITIENQQMAKNILGNFCYHCHKGVSKKINCTDNFECMLIKQRIANDWFGYGEEK